MKMKIRKLIPLAILAVVAVVALSSCDAMLDAIFSKNSIQVDVMVYAPNSTYTSYWDYYYSTPTVQIDLVGPSSTTTANYNGTSWDGYYVHYYFKFQNLADGTYYPTVYYSGGYTGGTQTTSYIYDSSGYYYIGTSVAMPYTGSYSTDSSGHSLSVVMK